MRPLDEVAFPVPRHQSFFDLRRPIMDAHHVWNLPSPIFATCARTAFGMTKA